MYDPGQLYSDPILTNFSLGYQDQELHAEDIMPTTPVNTPSGRYRVFDRSDWLIFPSRREPGTVANEVRGRKWSEDVFLTKEHSLQSAVHDEEDQELQSQGGLANPTFGGDLQIDPHEDATNLVTRSILLERELKVANQTRNAANYGASNKVTLAGASQWDDYTGGAASTSNPVAVIRLAMLRIKQATGRYPNTLAIPAMGVSYIEEHPRIVARFTNFNLTDPDAFRELTGFQGKIVLTDAWYNSANNVDLAETLVSFWGKDVWLGIVDPKPGQKTLTFGKTFSQIYPDGTIRPADRWREEPRKSDLVRVSQKYDTKIVSALAGYIVKDAFSAGAF